MGDRDEGVRLLGAFGAQEVAAEVSELVSRDYLQDLGVLRFSDARGLGPGQRRLPEAGVDREVFGEGAGDRLEVAVEGAEVRLVGGQQDASDAQLVLVHELEVGRHVSLERVDQQDLAPCLQVDAVACSDESTGAPRLRLHDADHVAEQRVRLRGPPCEPSPNRAAQH